MITLYGVGISNYYNKVKLTLLEKQVPFQEEFVAPSQDEALLQRSPLGKIPFIQTPDGYLSESQAILEYLDETYPESALYPASTYAKAKVREIGFHLELNIELQARRLFGEAFFGAKISDEVKAEVRDRVEKGLAGVSRLGVFSPYLAGAEFTAADILGFVHFTMVGKATQIIYGENLVETVLPQSKEYLASLLERPTVQKVAADWQSALQQFLSGKSS